MNEPPVDEAPLALIAAVARNGVIGSDNRLPWRLPGDLRHFRTATLGKPVLMGRRTYESIGRPLPGRAVVVVSRDPAFAPAGVTVARGLEEAVAAGRRLARASGAAEVMVAGGGALYAALIGRARRLDITEVHLAPEGDTRFPALDPALWEETARVPGPRSEGDDAAFSFVTYVARAAGRSS